MIEEILTNYTKLYDLIHKLNTYCTRMALRQQELLIANDWAVHTYRAKEQRSCWRKAGHHPRTKVEDFN